MKKYNKIPTIEKKYVIDAYNNISEKFSQTRYKPWKSTKKFIDSIDRIDNTTSILEVGCGNGKNMYRNDISMFGIDSSEKLIDICVNKGLKCIVGDGCNLPYDEDTFDNIFSIAVIHHLSTRERRNKFIREMLRVCKVGGKFMLEGWATSDAKYNNSKKMENKNNDRLVSFTNNINNYSYDRFYHFFNKDEFEELCKIRYNGKYLEGKIYEEHNNWIFMGIVKKENI